MFTLDGLDHTQIVSIDPNASKSPEEVKRVPQANFTTRSGSAVLKP